MLLKWKMIMNRIIREFLFLGILYVVGALDGNWILWELYLGWKQPKQKETFFRFNIICFFLFVVEEIALEIIKKKVYVYCSWEEMWLSRKRPVLWLPFVMTPLPNKTPSSLSYISLCIRTKKKVIYIKPKKPADVLCLFDINE